MPLQARQLAVPLPDDAWTVAMVVDVLPYDTKTWAIFNAGPGMIAGGKIQVSMVNPDSPDDWIDHPESPPNMQNIAPETWLTVTSSGYAFPYYRVLLLADGDTTADVYVAAR